MTSGARIVKSPTKEGRFGRRGFTRFELAVAVAIISILFGIALTKYLTLLVDVERTSMAENVGAMRSAVALQMVERIAKGDMAGVAAMIDTNPMIYMTQTPATYLGERDHPEPANIAGGHWYYDRSSKELVYRVDHGRFFHTPLPGAPRAVFKIEPVFRDLNRDGAFEPAKDMLEGVSVKALEPYHWVPGAI